MADTKISALTSATTPLAGTEVLPIVQSGATVKVATNDLTVRNIRANATTGILQVTGPAAASTRVATVPDANFTVARTDAAQTFTGTQSITSGNLNVTAAAASSVVATLTGVNTAGSNAQIAMSLPGADSMTMTYVRSGAPAFEIVNGGPGVSLAYGGNSWASLSDERYKEIIAPIENAVSAVGNLRAVIGKYKSDKEGTRRSFLIAQDVQSVFPEAVDSSDQDLLKLSYTDVIPLLVAAINELSLEVAALKSK
jgi:hypothetical protein